MKKLKRGLFPKVVIAIVIGALLGLILPDVVVRIFKTFNVLSFVIGVGIIFTGANGLKKGFEEFGEIVKLTIENVIIPFHPVYTLSGRTVLYCRNHRTQEPFKDNLEHHSGLSDRIL